MRKWSISLIIREMQINATVRYHLTSIRVAIIKNPKTISVGEDVVKLEHLLAIVRKAKQCSHWRKHYGSFSNNLK